MYERHGHSTLACRQTKTYRAWSSMKNRALNPKHPDYKHYGARGITVCWRWLTFVNFLADMGESPLGMTLERKDNSGDYEPGNCRWATRADQGRNTRRTKMVDYRGERMCLAEWAHRYGLLPQIVHSRIRSGWTIEKALTVQPRHRRSHGIR